MSDNFHGIVVACIIMASCSYLGPLNTTHTNDRMCPETIFDTDRTARIPTFKGVGCWLSDIYSNQVRMLRSMGHPCFSTVEMREPSVVASWTRSVRTGEVGDIVCDGLFEFRRSGCPFASDGNERQRTGCKGQTNAAVAIVNSYIVNS